LHFKSLFCLPFPFILPALKFEYSALEAFGRLSRIFHRRGAESAEKKNDGLGSTTPGGVVIVYPWFQFLCVLCVSAVKYAR
jgi:hypothetical protein